MCRLALLLLVVPHILADNTPVGSRKVRARRVDKAPTLDGLVTEDLWSGIAPAAAFVQQEPNEGASATESTEIRIAFDDNNLYIGIICFDSEPDNIVVTQNRRDASLIDTDSVEILLDTFHDRQNAFIFGTSPTGIEYDGQLSKAGQGRGGVGTPARAGGAGGGGGAQRGGASAFNLNWDGVWKVWSKVTERGWESEMVIPFKTLRYTPGSDRTWGLNITRNLRRRNEQSFWAPVSRGFTFNDVAIAGELEGLDVEVHRNLKLLPYVLGGFKQNYTEPDATDPALNAGLDLKYSLTPGLTLDATFNTDFAQVEVDEEQVNLTRFDLFFPEKRPFFLENSGFFEFGTPREVEAFFSRRIGIDRSGIEVPIDAGVRLSGKMGNYEIGALDMMTREVEGVVPANNFSVLRVARELRNRSSIGLIAVGRNSLTGGTSAPSYNYTFGADLNIGFGRHANWFNYLAKSLTPGLTGRDHAASSVLAYDDEHHRADAGYTEVGRDFNPEVGYVQRVGFRKPTIGYRYTHYPEGKLLRSIFPHFQWNRWYTLETNEKESAFEHYHLDTRWQNGSSLGLALNRNFERLDKPFEVSPGVLIPPGRYDYSEMVLNYGTDPSAHLLGLGQLLSGRLLLRNDPDHQRERRLPLWPEYQLDRKLRPQLHRATRRGFYDRPGRSALQLVFHAQELPSVLQPVQQPDWPGRNEYKARAAFDLEHGLLRGLQHACGHRRLPRSARRPAPDDEPCADGQVQLPFRFLTA